MIIRKIRIIRIVMIIKIIRIIRIIMIIKIIRIIRIIRIIFVHARNRLKQGIMSTFSKVAALLSSLSENNIDQTLPWP